MRKKDITMLRVEDLNEDNVDDAFRVCSHNKLDDQIQRKGIELKKKWLLDILENYGPCMKIAYIDDHPVGEVQFYPETMIPYIPHPRDRVIVLHCIYNPFPEFRQKGVGRALIEGLIDNCRIGIPILEGRSCNFIVTRPFTSGEGLPLSEFLFRFGFLDGLNEMYLNVSGSYYPMEEGKYVPLVEDRGRAIILYEPVCEWSHSFNLRVSSILKEMVPNYPIDLINSWERPEESIRRGNQWLVVNAHPIHSFVTNEEVFRDEVSRARGES
jgi:GNAT superfamily N-acetyltransferase